MDFFYFYKDNSELSFNEDQKIILVPKNITNSSEIFACYDHELKIPEDFGKNWDAFFDNIKGFDFIKNKNVIAIHEDIPFLNNSKNQQVYIRILAATVEFWWEHMEHKFFVYFPEKLQANLQQILKDIQMEE